MSWRSMTISHMPDKQNIPDDIQQVTYAAQKMVERFGNRAPAEATIRALEREVSGDQASANTWWGIVKQTEILTGHSA